MEDKENITKSILSELSAQFLDPVFCTHWVLKKHYLVGPQCPNCKKIIIDSITLKNFWSLKRCVCKSCKKWFTATSGTFLRGSQLSAREIILLAILSGYGAPNKEIARVLDIHPDTIRLWQSKLNLIRGSDGDKCQG